jgi:hypothetical protein
MPKYLSTKDRSPYGGPAEVIVDDAWPGPHLVAREGDEIGAAIIAYVKKFKDHPDFPASPFSERHGEVHLPDLDKPQPEFDERPRYRLRDAGAVNAMPAPAGFEFDFDFWPPHGQMRNYEPINESARRVHKFRVRYGNRPSLPGQPYDRARRQLVLPPQYKLDIFTTENVPAYLRASA